MFAKKVALRKVALVQPPGSRLRILKLVDEAGGIGEQIFCSSNKSMEPNHTKQCRDWAQQSGFEIVADGKE